MKDRTWRLPSTYVERERLPSQSQCTHDHVLPCDQSMQHCPPPPTHHPPTPPHTALPPRTHDHVLPCDEATHQRVLWGHKQVAQAHRAEQPADSWLLASGGGGGGAVGTSGKVGPVHQGGSRQACRRLHLSSTSALRADQPGSGGMHVRGWHPSLRRKHACSRQKQQQQQALACPAPVAAAEAGALVDDVGRALHEGPEIQQGVEVCWRQVSNDGLLVFPHTNLMGYARNGGRLDWGRKVFVPSRAARLGAGSQTADPPAACCSWLVPTTHHQTPPRALSGICCMSSST